MRPRRLWWWEQLETLTVEELTARMTEATARAVHHDEMDRPLLAQAARRKATRAGEELNRRRGWVAA